MTFSTDILKNPEIFQINTCKPHSSHIHYRSAAECKEQQSSFFLSLNGDWKFFYSENLNALPEHFEQVGYDDSNWDTIPVPGHLQTNGYGQMQYVNTMYPWDGVENCKPGEIPERFNATGSYIRMVTIPEAFRKDAEIRLVFHGAETAMALWVNGTFVGYHEDSFTPAEFAITDYLNDGENKIAVQGFEETSYPDSFFDCVIGNVPFGAYQVSDRRYDRHHFMIHDYFIAKSLDLVRPGGVVAVVTSSGTMDKQNPAVRQYIANRAELLGAIRLPNNAFQRNANTSVVSDILFFQKRDRASIEEPEWLNLKEIPEGYSVNAYFAEHPEMVLGDFTTESTQYGKQEVTVKAKEGADLAEQLKEAVKHIQGTITEQEISDTELEEQVVSIPADPDIKNFSFALVGEDIYYRENSVMNKMELPVVTGERVRGMRSGMQQTDFWNGSWKNAVMKRLPAYRLS